jgi:hypothetical protein
MKNSTIELRCAIERLTDDTEVIKSLLTLIGDYVDFGSYISDTCDLSALSAQDKRQVEIGARALENLCVARPAFYIALEKTDSLGKNTEEVYQKCLDLEMMLEKEEQKS